MRKNTSLGVGLGGGLGADYKIGIIASLSATVIWLILGGLWTLVVTFTFSFFHSNLLPWQYFVAGISVGIPFTTSVLLYINKRKNKFKPSFPSLSSDYMIKKVETEMYFKKREEILYSSSFDILALSETKGMIRTHKWSGNSIIGLPVIKSTRNHKVELYKEEPRKMIYVAFEVPLQKNEETDCTLIYELKDSSNKMLPYLAHYVKNPTEKIILRLCVPKGLVNSVKKCIYADSSAQISLSVPQIINPRYIGDIDMYEWEIHNPSFLYYYRMCWTFV